jgi:hypothetical protein
MVRIDRNISVLQAFVSEGKNYSRLQQFINGKDLSLSRELQDKLTLGFWDRFVIVILNVFSPELSAKKVASFVGRYISELKKPIELETLAERMARNLNDLGLGQYAYLFIQSDE